jgi:hypothetical protein
MVPRRDLVGGGVIAGLAALVAPGAAASADGDAPHPLKETFDL